MEKECVTASDLACCLCGSKILFCTAQPKAIYDESPEVETHDTETGELKQRKPGPSKDRLQPFKR